MANPAQQAPWSVKGIAPQTREAVKEAARRSGMTIGEWLNAAIAHQAGKPVQYPHEGPSAHDLRWAEIASHLAKYVRQQAAPVATPQMSPSAAASQTVSLHAIERLLKETQMRHEQQAREQAIRVAEALTGLARYIERAETRRSEETQKIISQREQTNSDLSHMLNLVAHRIKRMERQIAHIPQEIIAPVKEAAAEQIHALSAQVIPEVGERLAVQMRDILHNLSIHQNQPSVSSTVDNEQLKIEDRLARAIVDIRSRQVELARLETTNHDDASHSAILERLEGLSRQLDAALVSNKNKSIDIGLNDVLQRLDRIDSRLECAQAPLDVGRVEEMVQQLSGNIEALHIAGKNTSTSDTGKEMLDKLAEQISLLAQHIDHISRQSLQSSPENTGAITNHERLSAIETTISALSLQLRDLPKVNAEALERLAKVAARETLAFISDDENIPARQRSTRTDDALDAVHNTLERVVKKLSKLEDEIASRTNTCTSAIKEPERRAAQALSQAPYNHPPSDNILQDGPENLLERETVGLTENIGLTANFIAAARRAAMAAANETRPITAEFQSRQFFSEASADVQNQAEITTDRRRSLLMGLGALVAATGAAQIANLFMQELPPFT